MVSAASKDHSNNIDALRLVLALLVLYSHSYPLGSGSEVYEPLAMLSHGQSTLGGLAVTSFFILSGYLIAQSWDRSRDTRSFFIKRVRRIYPGYLVASAICVWLVVPIASEQGSAVYSWRALLDNSWRFLALRGFKIPPTFVTNPMPLAVNGSLWSIPFEFWCYIGTMVLGITQVIHRRRLMLGVFVASILTHFVVEYQQLTPGGKILGVIFGYPKFWARLLPCYLAGTLFYLYRDRVRLDWRCAVFSLVGILLATQVPHGLIFAIPTLVAYVLVYLSFTRDIRLPAVAARGDFSYGVYLYSFPIQQLIMFFIGTTVAPITLFLLAVVPAVLAGVASWYLVERRFLRAKCRPSFPIDVHPERIEPNDHATYPTSPI